MVLDAFCNVKRTRNICVIVLKSRLKTGSFNFCQQRLGYQRSWLLLKYFHWHDKLELWTHLCENKKCNRTVFFFYFLFFYYFLFFVCLILVVIYFLVLWISKISVTVMSQLSSCTFCYRFPISKMHNNRKSMHYNINSLKIVWMDAKSLCNFCIPLLLHPYKKERNFRKEKLFKFIFFLYLGTWKNTFPSVMLVWKSS